VKLDDLDDRLVPRMAEKLRAFVDAAAERRSRMGQAVRHAATSVLRPSAAGPLARLDNRFAARGPLALLRDVPQLGLLLVAAVFLTGSGVALERSGNQNRADTARQQAEAAIPTTLGPAPGTQVATYLAETRKRAVAVSQVSPDGRYTALVSFSSYLTPQQTEKLLGELTVNKVLAHVKLPNAEVLPIPISTGLVPEVTAAFAAVATRKVNDRKEFLSLAGSITGDTKEDRAFRVFYTDSARTAGLEAVAYGKKSCACLFAALVKGKARELAALPSLAGIRAVDIGGGSADTLRLQPLLPEQTTTVTRPISPAGGNGA
jgi:hypothetical protein